ncbi:MAG TPA: glutathione S-transferase family protein [Nevskiaceae bacterium]|nr:glutathione S-transferase family protein [Nevskiaceae bacterium]
MKLYTDATTPYGRKVRVVIHELGLADKVEEQVTDPYNPPPEFLAANPLSKIPTLVTEHGEALPDSRLIVEYLLTRGRGLAPLGRGSKRWAMLRRVQVAEGLIDAAVATVVEKRRPESIVYHTFLDRQAAAIRRCVDMLNLEVNALSLEQIGLAEITAGVALSYLELRLPYLEWRALHEPLSAWHTQFAQRPSMLATAPPPGS